MTIDDKLQTLSNNLEEIAENEQKVYDAGYNSGYNSGYDEGKSCKDMTDFSYYHYNGARLDMLDKLNTEKGTNFRYMYAGCTDIESVPEIDTSNSVNNGMVGMFQDCKTLRNLPKLDVSNCDNLSYLFQNCAKLINIPTLDTRKCVVFSNMFNGCAVYDTLSINTQNGTTFSNMFGYASNLFHVDLGNTKNGTKFDYMFNKCEKLETISGLNLSSMTSCGNMFKGCTNLTTIKFASGSYIARNNISFADCNILDIDTLQSICHHLHCDLMSPYDKPILTLSSTSWDILESSQPPFDPWSSTGERYGSWKEYLSSAEVYWDYA